MKHKQRSVTKHAVTKRPTPAKAAKTASAESPEITDDDGKRFMQRLKQVTLCEILGTQPKFLLEWEAAGMPRLPDGRYDLAPVIFWLRDRWKRAAKATPAETGDPMTQQQYDGLRAKYRALEQRQKYLEQGGMLMPRSDAEREMLRMAMQLRASLMAQPEILAAQLANCGPEQIAKHLMERFQWMCRTFEDGMVPLSAEVGRAIDDLVAKLRAEELPGPASAGAEP